MSHTLSGCISTASFLYCLLISSSEASLGTPRTLQYYKPPIAMNSLSTLFIVLYLFWQWQWKNGWEGKWRNGRIYMLLVIVIIICKWHSTSTCINARKSWASHETPLFLQSSCCCLNGALWLYWFTRLNNKNFLKTRLLIFAMSMIVNLIKLNLFLFICLFI